MRFKLKKRHGFDQTKWHDVFAWWPITIEYVIVWLETAQRRQKKPDHRWNPPSVYANQEKIKYEYRIKPTASEHASMFHIGCMYQHKTLSEYIVLKLSEELWLSFDSGSSLLPTGINSASIGFSINRYSDNIPLFIGEQFNEI